MSEDSIRDIEWLMHEAQKEAVKAEEKGEVPVGAIIVDSLGRIVSKGHNLKETKNNACLHAEIVAIEEASKKINNWRILDHTLIVTLEPCPMCLYAAISARIKKIIFGAYDPKGGALSLGYHFHLDDRLNHKVEIIGGINHFENSAKLSHFFKHKRSSY